MSTTTGNRRIGAFVLFVDDSGVRYAVRLSAVLALSDGDESRDSTIMQMPGGRATLVRAPLDEVLAWFT
jgi:hypothetical protein